MSAVPFPLAAGGRMKRQPEAQKHGEAWRYFSGEMTGRQYGETETRDAWLWFLAGWLSKAKQRQNFRITASDPEVDA